MIELELLNKTFNDLDWLRKSFLDIQKDFGGLFIAIRDNKIIDSSRDKESLFKQLIKNKIKLETVLIEYIPKKDEVLIL